MDNFITDKIIKLIINNDNKIVIYIWIIDIYIYIYLSIYLNL